MALRESLAIVDRPQSGAICEEETMKNAWRCPRRSLRGLLLGVSLRPSARRHSRSRGWSATLGAVALATALAGCGSGWTPEPPAEFAITWALVNANGDGALVQGNGFLPPGSACPAAGASCEIFGPPVFGVLGPYELRWSNAATGGSGSIHLTWICNCRSQQTVWVTGVPIAPGPNAITVTMTAESRAEQDTINLTGP